MTAVALRNWDFSPRLTPFSDLAVRPGTLPNIAFPELTELVQPSWVEATRRNLEKLQILEDNWDGYAAAPIRHDVISYAQVILNRIMREKTPAPHITPMAHSGVMLEWHERDVELEIEIERPGSIWIAFEDCSMKEEFEGLFSNNLEQLEEWIDRLSNGPTELQV